MMLLQSYKEDVDDWCCFSTLKSHGSTVWSVAFDKTGTRLASCSDDRTVKIWHEPLPTNADHSPVKGAEVSWKCACTISGYHERPIYDVEWSHISGHNVTAFGDDCIRVFRDDTTDVDAPSFDLLTATHGAHSQDVNSVIWNPAIAGMLASCSDDGCANVWMLNEDGEV